MKLLSNQMISKILTSFYFVILLINHHLSLINCFPSSPSNFLWFESLRLRPASPVSSDYDSVNGNRVVVTSLETPLYVSLPNGSRVITGSPASSLSPSSSSPVALLASASLASSGSSLSMASSSSSSSSSQPSWTSPFVALGSEETESFSLPVEQPGTVPGERTNAGQNDLTSGHGNQTKHYISSISGSPRTRIFRCDKTLAIIDYIDDSRIFRCELYDLEKRPEEARTATLKRSVPLIEVTFHFLEDIINKCLDLERFTYLSIPQASALQSDEPEANRQNTTESMISFWRGVMPGTKWCGLGDIAKNYFDVGQMWDIDLCCRAHDHCPYRLKAFRYGYGLLNLSFYTRSHCACDEDFYRCLKKSNTNLGSTLGNIYFNVIQVQCFKEEEERNCVKTRMTQDGKEECITFATNGNRKMIFSQPKAYE